MNPVTIGSPVIFYWSNNVEIAGIVAGTRVEDTITYYYVALFDVTGTFSANYVYPSATLDTSHNPGTFQVVSTPATIS